MMGWMKPNVFAWRHWPWSLVMQPNRWSSRLIYGLFLGAMATAFRYYSVYETGVCFAIVLAGAFPEWLDRLAQRAERIRFMRKEEKRLAQHREP